MSTTTSSSIKSSSQQQEQHNQQSSSSKTTEIATEATSTLNIKSVSSRANNSKEGLQIFLGGSCNPTTWRKNVAIPYLELNGISYYNPQIDNWTPEVVNLERYAKQNAQLLLFVIDRQTRSTVSIVESAFMAGEKKNLVLVIYPFDNNIVSSAEDTITKDTQTTKQTMSNIETRSKHLTKTSLAINKNSSASSVVKSSTSSSSTSKTSSTFISTTANDSNPTTTLATASSTKTSMTTAKKVCSSSKVEPDGMQVKKEEEIHHHHHEASGTFRMSGELISLNEFQELRQARYILQNLIVLQKIPIFSDIQQALNYIACSVRNMSEITTSCRSFESPVPQHLPVLVDSGESKKDATILGRHDHRLEEISSTTETDSSREVLNRKFNNLDELFKDVYLSLDCDDQKSIESIVIPILKEKGLSYYYMFIDNVLKYSAQPTKSKVDNIFQKFSIEALLESKTSSGFGLEQMSGYSNKASSQAPSSSKTLDMFEITKSALEREICTIRKSRVLLFVITNKCRGLSIMVLASHFMALFRNNVVLCVQYLEEPCSINGENLTQTAIADYNRGRIYLNDYAIKSQVPVFSTIQEAIECCSRKCQYNISRNNKN